MTDAVTVALIGAGVTIVGYLDRRGQKKLEAKVMEVHIMINSRLSELLKVTSAAEHARGKLEGAQEEKDRIR